MRFQLELSVDDAAIGGIVEQVRRVVETTVADQLRKVTFPQPTEAVKPTKPQAIVSGGVNLPEVERIKAADLRTAILLGKIPDDTGLLIDVKTTAKLLNVSERMVYRLADQKAAPCPVRLGTLVRWRLAEIIEWIDSGCPSKWKWPRSKVGQH